MGSIENLDLESGGNTGLEETGLELLWSKRPKSNFLSNDLGFFFSSSESNMCKCGIQSSSSLDKYRQVMIESGEVKIDLSSEESQGRLKFAEKTYDNERHKNTNSRNALKPPRPPKGPSLDAADQKLVREIADLARRKRARIEQIKAAKKAKATKSSSVQSGISALIFTLLFFCVMIFKVAFFPSLCASWISSTTVPNMNTLGSPEPAIATARDLIFLQYSESTTPRSSFHISVKDQVSRSGPGAN